MDASKKQELRADLREAIDVAQQIHKEIDDTALWEPDRLTAEEVKAAARELAETVCEGYDAMRKLLETLGPLAYASGVTSP
jgi:hypothetical protein